ncbi:MAG TPA: C39 family peptidase [Terracidiphilus sp.]|nr:C39 family peptidase [Terracidiphilus sp.]
MARSTLRVAGLMLALCAMALAASPAGVWLDVPYVAQTKDGCGAATLAMVMQYWQRQQGRPSGPAADATHILDSLYAADAHGIYASAMVRYLQKNGYRAFAFTGDLPLLRHHLSQGRPLIAALRPRGSRALHYVVVAGMDPERHLVLVNDPARRKLQEEDEVTFVHEWEATGRWTLLAVPAGGALPHQP